MKTLEHVAMQARPYPADLLVGCETGGCLFSAAFRGWNDAIHFALAGVQTVCVDIDDEALAEMRPLYPDDWVFVEADAWEYAEQLRATRNQLDVVSVDTFTGAAMHRALDSVDLWCSIARKAVTLTYTDGAVYRVPDGWRASLYHRSGDVNWLVLERC